MSRFRAVAASLNGFLAAASAVATIVVVFVPDLRSWMSDHGLLGWIAAMVILAASFLAFAWSREGHREDLKALQREVASSQQQVEAHALEVSRLQSELDNRRTIEKDLTLVHELLGDIQPRSRFHEYLKHRANFKHLPAWFANELDSAEDRWRLDPRSVEAPDLAEAWSSVRTTGERFSDLMTQNLWHQDSGPGSASKPDWLTIPIEWNFRMKESAYDELDDARLDFSDALDELFALVHRLT